MGEWADRRVDVQCMVGQTDRQTTDGWMDGWTERLTDGQTDRRDVGWMDRHVHVNPKCRRTDMNVPCMLLTFKAM